MSEICKNCSTEIVLNFCGNCGQKKAKRIDRTYIKDELQYTVLHMNKGFFYSIKKILRAPGKTAREFLEGNRVNHYKPILLVFVVSGISAFLTNFFIPHPEEIIARYYETLSIKAPYNIRSFYAFIFKYQAIMMLAMVPYVAFFSWIVFKKWGYNYYENIVITAFSLIFLQVLSVLIVFPFQFIFKGNPVLFMTIPMILTTILGICGFPWFYINLYNNKAAGDIILRLFCLLFIFFIVSFILCIIGGIVLGLYLANNNIDPNIYFGLKSV